MIDEEAFTLIEILVVISILVILVLIGVVGYGSLQGTSELSSSAEKVISVLRLAQRKTLDSEEGSQYGVYFATSTPHRYVLFEGPSYEEATSTEVTYELPERVEFFKIDLNGNKQVVFERLSGSAEAGEVGLRLKEETSETKLLQIKESGWVELK